MACMKTARPLGWHYWRVFRRGLRWYKCKGFTCEEMYYDGLLHPDFPSGQIDYFLSRKETTSIQLVLNPSHCSDMLKNKILLYRYLEAAQLPHPKVFAIFDKTTAGVSSCNRMLQSRQDWIDYIRTELPNDFIIKPAYGAKGMGVKHIQKHGNGLMDGKEAVDFSWLYDYMKSYPDSPAYIIQQRIINHPAIVEFTEKQALQTVRIITYVNKRCEPDILYAAIKFVCGKNTTDHYLWGRSGNVFSFIDVQHGQVKPAYSTSDAGKPAEPQTMHPETQRRFDELNLPFWQETVQLARCAAMLFLPVRCIGWDIAITEAGPSIVEGNIWWDPYNRLAYKQRIVDDLGCDPFQIRLSQKRRPNVSDFT